ncbi:hypothetical protein GCM10027037_16210 [Mucilaginibacter koreensis]
MISEIEQETLDFSWFFTNGEKIGFVASGGGKLPNSIANQTHEAIAELASYFEALPPISSVIVNPAINKLITPGTNKHVYISFFAEMAERGIYAFDKTACNNFLNTNYHWVAYPATLLKLSHLPANIATRVMQTTFTGDFNADLDLKHFN